MSIPGSGGHEILTPESHARRGARLIAITLAILSLGCGVYGVLSLTPEMLGMGMIAFGCLLAIIALLAQAAEHFARAAHAEHRTH